MTGIGRRIRRLEEQTGSDEELKVKVIVMMNYARESCSRFKKCTVRDRRDWKSCLDYKRWTPQANGNGYALFRPNCRNCKGV